jgi:hypothetical protein
LVVLAGGSGVGSRELSDVPYNPVYLGEMAITDAAGNQLARMG